MKTTLIRASIALASAALCGCHARVPLVGSEMSIKKASRLVEEELIRKALVATGGNRTNAAKILEISHRALLYKIKEYGISGL